MNRQGSQAARVAAICAAGVAALALTAPSANAAIFCGKTITADLTMKRDLTDCPADGLVIGANGVTIDLNGHTIDGVGADNSEGVLSQNWDGARVRGPGKITNFDIGVSLQSSAGGGVRRVRVKRTESAGVELRSGVGTRLTASTIHSSESYGISVVHCDTCEVIGNTVQGPDTSSFSSYGMAVSSSLGGDNLVKRNLVRAGAASSFGMLVFGDADHTRVRSNVFRGRDIMSEGLSVYDGATNTLVKGNVAKGNLFNGIDVESGAGAGTDVGGNLALNNGQWGIRAQVAVTDLGGNRAAGNGQAGQCSGVVCTPP
jgi:hypothetical protein